MELTVRDSARLLRVSEKTIYRWVQQGKLPAYRVNEQYRFNRAELLEWATAERMPISPEIYHEPNGPGVATLAEALRAGGVCYRVGGHDKRSVLESVVELMPLPDKVDRQFLLDVLLARESLGSTALGDGIAVPHVRNPIVMHIARPMITLCFLEQAIEFGAMDGKPVHTLFTIVSPTMKAHLHLLSRLGLALRQAAFVQALTARGSRQEILGHCEAVDRSIPPPDGDPSTATTPAG